MITRSDVLEKASIDCLKELYKLAQPSVDWDDFMQENKEYAIKYKEWDDWKIKKIPHPEWEGKSMIEILGPRPYEFYYLPRNVMKEIADSYVRAYRIDTQQELLNTIEILKSYCKDTIIDKYIDEHIDENGNWHPGYRGYEHPDNLEKELYQVLKEYFNDSETDPNIVAKELQDKFFEFLDMAGKFYSWNRDLNAFNTTVYLGPSPSSNKQAVIDNWKKYRNKDITIDDSVYENEEE